MKTLQIIETAYRATAEEQDDTIVWITHNMAGVGADLDVVLCGGAVNYAAKEQDASGLSFGDWRQSQPPQMAHEIDRFIQNGIQVYLIDEDVKDRGLKDKMLIDGVERIPRRVLPVLFKRYERIWRW